MIQPFRAWRQTFPFLAAGRAALESVELAAGAVCAAAAMPACLPPAILIAT